MEMLHFMLLERNLPYTGVTQGKQLVVVIAQPKPWLWRLKISDLNAG
jgi:exodeoxyribonuclease V alpha subunit